MISLPVRFEFQQRRPEWIETLTQRHAENQPVQILQRQRPEQQCIDRTKDRSVCADAYRERSYSDRGVTWGLQQHPSAVTDILPEASKHKMGILCLSSHAVFNNATIKQMYSAIGMLCEALIMCDHANSGVVLM